MFGLICNHHHTESSSSLKSNYRHMTVADTVDVPRPICFPEVKLEIEQIEEFMFSERNLCDIFSEYFQ